MFSIAVILTSQDISMICALVSAVFAVLQYRK